MADAVLVVAAVDRTESLINGWLTASAALVGWSGNELGLEVVHAPVIGFVHHLHHFYAGCRLHRHGDEVVGD